MLVLFLSLSGAAWAQVKISGEVTHDGEPLDQVTIRLYENGEYLHAIAVNRKGRYQANLPYGHRYEFVFSRPYMVKVKILINTEVDEKISNSQNIYEVPFNMVMHYRYKGMDVSKCREPIGVILMTGSGEESFQFIPDNKALAEMKRVNSESQQLEKKGGQPIMDVEEEQEEEVPERVVTSKSAEEETAEADRASTEAEERAEETAMEEAVLEVKNERQETLKRATKLQSNNERIRQARASNAAEQRGAQELESIYSNKTIRSERLVELQEEQESNIDRQVLADSVLDSRLMAAAAAYKRPEEVGKPIRTLRHEHKSGWLYDEELLFVKERNHEVVYKSTHWNWWVFETSYYYRNEHEIEAEEFEKIRALFRF